MKPLLKLFHLSVLTCLLTAVLLTTVSAQQNPNKYSFTFSKVDLELLEEANLLDAQLEKHGLIYFDRALEAYLERVGKSVIPRGAGLERVVWRFRVLRDPLANAFALPNGSVYVNTGLLALLENEAQLASVLSHEIAHVVGRHSYLAQRSYRKKMMTVHILEAASFWVPTGSVVGTTISLMASVAQPILKATISGYSRELEMDADLDGFNRLVSSGYDPAEMVRTFALLQQSPDVDVVKLYYNDHPKLQERMAYINDLRKKLTNRDKVITADKQHYWANVEKVARHDLQLNIDSGRYRTAVAIGKKLVDFNPEDADNIFYLAEAYRALGPRTPEASPAELAAAGKKEARRIKQQYTLEEEEKLLLATSAGKAAWQANQVKAEELYLESLAIDRNHTKAHRGLGMLYEKSDKIQPAIDHYRKYLDLQPEAGDRVRIQRRIETLEQRLEKVAGKAAPGRP
jgi:predicted Zn-dependent protease